MITGKCAVTGVELGMAREDAERLIMSLDATAHLCEQLIRSSPDWSVQGGSLLLQLPNTVIRALRAEASEHRKLSAEIRSAMVRLPS